MSNPLGRGRPEDEVDRRFEDRSEVVVGWRWKAAISCAVAPPCLRHAFLDSSDAGKECTDDQVRSPHDQKARGRDRQHSSGLGCGAPSKVLGLLNGSFDHEAVSRDQFLVFRMVIVAPGGANNRLRARERIKLPKLGEGQKRQRKFSRTGQVPFDMLNPAVTTRMQLQGSLSASPNRALAGGADCAVGLGWRDRLYTHAHV
jgi:hypothetical protein